MHCRSCYSTDLSLVPFDIPLTAGRWFRCGACGADTAAHGYDGSQYSEEYFQTHTGVTDRDLLHAEVRSNCEWFGHYAADLPNRDFLDVGCADGAALDVMQSLGWAVHGFDVSRPSYFGPHVTVGAVFSRWMFPLRYAAVLCREVIEHVENPDFLLHELHGVACPGGLVQIQTQKPVNFYSSYPYQMPHLCLIPPARMRQMLDGAMFDVLDAREWDTGHAYLCRART